MITIWITYLLAAVAASGIFVVAGLRSKHPSGLAGTYCRHGLATDPLWGDAEIDIAASEARSDVGAACRLALKRLAPLIAGQSMQVEIACPSGLMVRMRSAALADLLEELLAASIHEAPSCRLLITATTRGERVYVAITDDMAAANLAVRQGSAHGLTERVAMRGGALDISIRPTEGTTVTLRLAAAPETDRPMFESSMPWSGSSAGFTVRVDR